MTLKYWHSRAKGYAMKNANPALLHMQTGTTTLTNEDGLPTLYKFYSYKREDCYGCNLSFIFIPFSKKRLIFCIFILNFLLPYYLSLKSIYILIFLKEFYENFTSLEKVVDFYI